MIDVVVFGSKSKKYTEIKENHLKGNDFCVISITNPEEKKQFSESEKTLNLEFTNMDGDLSPEYLKFQQLVVFDINTARLIIDFINRNDEIETPRTLYICSEDLSRGPSIALWLKGYLGLDEDKVILYISEGEEIKKNEQIIEILKSQE